MAAFFFPVIDGFVLKVIIVRIGKVSDGAKDAVTFCLNSEIVNVRSSSLLAADTLIIQAEVAMIIERALKKSGLILTYS